MATQLATKYLHALCANVTSLATYIVYEHFPQKWPTVHMAFNGAVLNLCNGVVPENTPQIFDLRYLLST